jgi:ribulose 1,5-bisphosphate synthetase/thiazole synthase
MVQTSDVVVIGGGMIGLAVAYSLGRARVLRDPGRTWRSRQGSLLGGRRLLGVLLKKMILQQPTTLAVAPYHVARLTVFP